MPLTKPPNSSAPATIEINNSQKFGSYWEKYFQEQNQYINNKVPEIYIGTAAPTTTPRKVGDIFVDTSTPNVYISRGTSSSSDWKLV